MTINNQITLKRKQNNRKMYSLNYQVTTSTCDSEGRLKLYSALQMMQDCSEMWIDSEPGVKQYFAEQNMVQLALCIGLASACGKASGCVTSTIGGMFIPCGIGALFKW